MLRAATHSRHGAVTQALQYGSDGVMGALPSSVLLSMTCRARGGSAAGAVGLEAAEAWQLQPRLNNKFALRASWLVSWLALGAASCHTGFLHAHACELERETPGDECERHCCKVRVCAFGGVPSLVSDSLSVSHHHVSVTLMRHRLLHIQCLLQACCRLHARGGELHRTTSSDAPNIVPPSTPCALLEALP